jgi:hypothetical protein
MTVGLFVGPVSRTVGDAGKLYATEVSDAFTQHLKELVQKDGLKNVSLELVPACPEAFTSIPAGSVDIALICDVYHHFEYPKSTMRGKTTILLL